MLALPGQSERPTLVDADGGSDWIDAAAVLQDLSLSLVAGQTSTLGGTPFLTIATDTLIENAIGGDGNDRIEGNAADNLIYGMRGDDILIGGDGSDTAVFHGRAEDYSVSEAEGIITVQSLSGAGTDTLTGFEGLLFV
ncbi:M10 family metallopeptidase C-terminal domain-containing protein [Azotobacter sp. CWF10]